MSDEIKIESESGEKKLMAKFQQSIEKNYRLTFKENRSFEITILGTTYFFSPNGSQIISDKTLIKMTDEEKLFFIVEALENDK